MLNKEALHAELKSSKYTIVWCLGLTMTRGIHHTSFTPIWLSGDIIYLMTLLHNVQNNYNDYKNNVKKAITSYIAIHRRSSLNRGDGKLLNVPLTRAPERKNNVVGEWRREVMHPLAKKKIKRAHINDGMKSCDLLG